jgi:hypothetical protein
MFQCIYIVLTSNQNILFKQFKDKVTNIITMLTRTGSKTNISCNKVNVNTRHLWKINEELVIQRENQNYYRSNIFCDNLHNRRFGKKWTINEELALQREYQLLKLSMFEIALRHSRTQHAILYKLESENFFIDDLNENENINLIMVE